VIDLSQWLQAYWWLVLSALSAIIMTFRFYHKRSARFRHTLDRIYLHIPVIGPILRKAAIARFARTLSTLSTAGVPLVDALTSVSGATGNHVYCQQVLVIRDKVSTGQQLQLSMQQTEVFPFLIIQMVAIGEESGSMDKMLSKVADFYEEEIDNAVDNLSDLLEPLIMVILGGLVGSLVVAMYLPIFKLGSVI
jgi:type IV pilus assembly protein PilC